MASTNLDEIGVRPLRVPDWSLGINTAKPSTEIEDNEVQDLLNLEFDDNGNLSARRGAAQLLSNTFANRITSLHYFTTESGEVGVLFTTGTTLQIVETNGTGLTNLTGSLTLPNDTFWQWVTFQGIAIGCNKATSGDNPVKVNAAGAASALGGSPPKARYIEVWNNRVWVASAAEPNQVRACALGNPEDWTSTGAAGAISIDIDPDDGDQIMGLFATKEALYVFKRKRIYTITASVQPNTDPANLSVDIFTSLIGCASPYSIRQVVNDVLFLSDQGVASLALVATAENFRTAFYSRNVKEITNFPKATEEIPAALIDTGAQYWLSLPATVSPTGKPVAYVMDYLKVDQGFVRWTRFDSRVAGTAYTNFLDSSGKVYLIGAPNGAGAHQIYKYQPRAPLGVFSDNGASYVKSLKTKSFNAGAQLINKSWNQWALGVNLLSAAAQLQIQYFFDQNPLRGGSYNFALQGTETGALWGPGLWAPGLWGTLFSGAFDILRELKSNNFGRESQDITFVITNAQINEGFTLQDFMLWYSALNERRVSEV